MAVGILHQGQEKLLVHPTSRESQVLKEIACRANLLPRSQREAEARKTASCRPCPLTCTTFFLNFPTDVFKPDSVAL